MRIPIIFLMLSVILVGQSSEVTGFEIDQPAKVKKSTFSLINFLPECTAPNTTTANGEAACTYSTAGKCRLLEGGKGSLAFATTKSKTDGLPDLAVTLQLSGLSSECEGASIYPRILYRRGAEGCGGGVGCVTLDDARNLIAGEGCVVAGGKCKYRLLVRETSSSADFPLGQNSSIRIRECETVIVPNPGYQPFSCGVILD